MDALLAQNTLIGILITMLFHLYSLAHLPLFIIQMRKKLSLHFLINLIAAVITVILSFPYSIEILIGWNGPGKNTVKIVDGYYNFRFPLQ